MTYGLEAEIDALLRYLETHGDVEDDRLPEWDEFSDRQPTSVSVDATDSV